MAQRILATHVGSRRLELGIDEVSGGEMSCWANLQSLVDGARLASQTVDARAPA